LKITIKYLEGIRDKTGEKVTEFEFPGKDFIFMHDFIIELLKKYGKNLRDIMFWKMSTKLVEEFMDKKRELKIDQIKFLINGNMCVYEGTKLLKEGDVIVLFLPLAGG
jgi:molybdopterin converting factor small subunit